jgi:hypothetical protein
MVNDIYTGIITEQHTVALDGFGITLKKGAEVKVLEGNLIPEKTHLIYNLNEDIDFTFMLDSKIVQKIIMGVPNG